MKRDFLEEDMYDLVHDYFSSLGYKVQGEVKSCDVTALKDDTLVILELKKSLSMELLLQAVKRQRLGDLTYICVPKPKHYSKNRKFQETLYLLKRLSLGLIFCEPDRDLLEVILHPQDFDMTKSKQVSKKQRDRLIHEIESRKTSINRGGSRGRKLMTAYREDAIKILWLASQNEIIAPKDGVKLGVKKTPSILRDNYYGWFKRVARGSYSITEAGEKALGEHAEILELVIAELKDLIELAETERKLQLVAPTIASAMAPMVDSTRAATPAQRKAQAKVQTKVQTKAPNTNQTPSKV